MTRHLAVLTVAAAAILAPQHQARAQDTDVVTLLQSVENCLAWMNSGFPDDRTPFSGGFEVVEPFSDGGEGVYREIETGFEITLRQEGDTAFCESTDGSVRLGRDGLLRLEAQLQDRVEDGRALQLAPNRYAFCAGPPGLLTVSETDGRATFLIEFNTDTALEAAGGC